MENLFAFKWKVETVQQEQSCFNVDNFSFCKLFKTTFAVSQYVSRDCSNTSGYDAAFAALFRNKIYGRSVAEDSQSCLMLLTILIAHGEARLKLAENMVKTTHLQKLNILETFFSFLQERYTILYCSKLQLVTLDQILILFPPLSCYRFIVV